MSDNGVKVLKLSSARKEQLIDITGEAVRAVKSSGIAEGLCHIYVPHTTAAVTINENADPDVKFDIILGLEKIDPADVEYQHVEGNSPAHIKSSLIGSSVSVIVQKGELLLGTWQGIFFCEFDGPRTREVHIKVISG